MYKQFKKDSSTKLKINGLGDNSEVTYVNTEYNIAVVSKNGTILGISKGSTDVLVIVTQGEYLTGILCTQIAVQNNAFRNFTFKHTFVTPYSLLK